MFLCSFCCLVNTVTTSLRLFSSTRWTMVCFYCLGFEIIFLGLRGHCLVFGVQACIQLIVALYERWICLLSSFALGVCCRMFRIETFRKIFNFCFGTLNHYYGVVYPFLLSSTARLVWEGDSINSLLFCMWDFWDDRNLLAPFKFGSLWGSIIAGAHPKCSWQAC